MPTASRRHFLLATAAAGVVTAAAPAAAGESSARVTRVDTHPLFAQAARAHGVPPALLAAVSYAQTRWQDHAGRPSSSMGYGPMHLVDGEGAVRARALVGKDDAPATVDTLGEAARAAGLSASAVRTDPAANVLAAAALLAERQRAAGRPVGTSTDPALWFATVAETSGLVTPATQLELADTVLATVRDGGRLDLADGSRLELPAHRAVVTPIAQRAPLARRAAASRRRHHHRHGQQHGQHGRDGHVEAPRGLDVEWVPAGYEQYGSAPGDYGNHDLAHRPRAPKITHLVIHDTEGYWDGVLDLVRDPTYVSWQYSLRSSDGHVAQHVQAKDVAWHAGNWWVNMHSIGLEHEGFAAQGAPWFSEPMYRTSARLVRYLCQQHRIPLDRAHVIGHDQVPGTTTATIPGMHWDPGPFWDWEHYFTLLGAPLARGTMPRRAQAGDVVRVLPGFAGNVQTVTGCEDAGDQCGAPRDTNFVTLRVAPALDAALVTDPGQHPGGAASTTEVADIAARATAGVEYVVAEVAGDWTAIWFLGGTAWFSNPAAHPTARVVRHPAARVRAVGTEPVAVYGRCYPEASAYADAGDVQAVSPLVYTLPPGQEYVVGDLHPVTDYYKAKTFTLDDPDDHVDIVGTDRYVQISLGHRIAFVRREDVEVLP